MSGQHSRKAPSDGRRNGPGCISTKSLRPTADGAQLLAKTGSIRRRRRGRAVRELLDLAASPRPATPRAWPGSWVLEGDPRRPRRLLGTATTDAGAAQALLDPVWPGLSRAPIVGVSLDLCSAEALRRPLRPAGQGGLGPRSGTGRRRRAGGLADPLLVRRRRLRLFGPAAQGDSTRVSRRLLPRGTSGGKRPLPGEALGVPADWRYFGAVLLGHPDGGDHPSPSLSRTRRSDAERIHRGRWVEP